MDALGEPLLLRETRVDAERNEHDRDDEPPSLLASDAPLPLASDSASPSAVSLRGVLLILACVWLVGVFLGGVADGVVYGRFGALHAGLVCIALLLATPLLLIRLRRDNIAHWVVAGHRGRVRSATAGRGGEGEGGKAAADVQADEAGGHTLRRRKRGTCAFLMMPNDTRSKSRGATYPQWNTIGTHFKEFPIKAPCRGEAIGSGMEVSSSGRRRKARAMSSMFPCTSFS